ncbi:MAG: glycosyltransferase family 2 protein [Thermodesulfobacteriota bacterium]|nr:glycosyltransferase family 2 protein [Thermodesulfobacteriota bacterium]
MGKFVSHSTQHRDIRPEVSIIIPAHNESKSIEQKLENTLSLNYPRDKMEILVGSDGSTDETADLAAQFSDRGVKTIRFMENRGKTEVQNDLVEHSSAEILIFTDAASFLHPNALNMIVRNFADKRIGCVAGRMRFIGTDTNLTTKSQGLYWRYEVIIKNMESKLGRLIGVDGPLYAVRRDCYVPLASHIISDLITPLLVLSQGKRVIWEPQAIVDEDPTHTSSEEFATRRRITLRGLVGLLANSQLMNPFKYPGLTFQIFFHKVLRWCVGITFILNVLACLALSTHWIFKCILVFYCTFFTAAAIGWLTERLSIRQKLFTVPYYFSLVNIAATMGILDLLSRKKVTSWKPVRH